ncbi:MAG TPA: IS1182 family transposase [Bacillus sp. (in: firmicutes)]|nr:IS1182 family transposase [Bacillus sp. (in: firmicutes)]
MGLLKFKPEQKKQLFLLPPSIEEFIAENHLARVIDGIVEKLDCRSIEEQYSFLGQKSYSPKMIIKLWIYSYCTGVFSGRKIDVKCETDTAYMFLAGMYRPDFRTINDFRKDNIDFFNKIFLDVLQICRQLGMAQVGTIAIDGTKIRANASAKRSKDKAGYEQWKSNIEKNLEQLHKQADEINAQEDKQLGKKRGDELIRKIRGKENLKQKIEKVLKEFENSGRNTKEKINLTDEDAKMMKSKGRIDTNYNCQGGVSMDGVIVAQYVETIANDKEQLLPLVRQVESNINEKPENILADSGYASYDSYEKIAAQNIVAYMPDQEYENREEKQKDLFDRNNFHYDAEKDHYICPHGKALRYANDYIVEERKQKSRVYTCKECTACPLKSQCTKSNQRSIYREYREPLREQARQRLDSPDGKKIYNQRMYTIEPIWGNIKFNHKFQMFSLKGKHKVTGEFSLMCTANNILKIYQQKTKKEAG